MEDHRARGLPTAPTSARSLLLTVLGEFLLPRPQTPVWSAAILAALGEVGVEPKTARQALARSARRGLIASERLGRRACWRLTPAGSALLSDGADRIFGFGQPSQPWDGQWLIVVLTPVEAAHQPDARLGTRLTWAGLGSLGPGVWVTPDAAKEKEVAAVLGELGVEAFCIAGPFGEIGNEQAVVRQAWSLRGVEYRYRDFLRHFTRRSPRARSERFRAQIKLVQAWSRFPYLDPGLPHELLPRTWPGPSAAQLFRERYEEWYPDAQAHWEALVAVASERR